MTDSYMSGERKTKKKKKTHIQNIFTHILKNIWKSCQKNEGEKLNINKQ